MIFTAADGKAVASEMCDANGVGHEDLALWLVQRGVSAVVCGNIGPGAQGALRAAGIRAFPGVEGTAEDAIVRFLAGELEPTAEATCGGGACGSRCGGCGGCHHKGDCL